MGTFPEPSLVGFGERFHVTTPGAFSVQTRRWGTLSWLNWATVDRTRRGELMGIPSYSCTHHPFRLTQWGGVWVQLLLKEDGIGVGEMLPREERPCCSSSSSSRVNKLFKGLTGRVKFFSPWRKKFIGGATCPLE